MILAGWQYWLEAMIIFGTHILIDGWKSYKKDNSIYFLIDQALHLFVILILWCWIFLDANAINNFRKSVNNDLSYWINVTAFIFITVPAGILVGKLTQKWRVNLPAEEIESLADAGKWIGIIERIIVLIFAIKGQYEAIGLLLAAKGLIRFRDSNIHSEKRTEYLVIGTLISIGLALVTGIAITLIAQ